MKAGLQIDTLAANGQRRAFTPRCGAEAGWYILNRRDETNRHSGRCRGSYEQGEQPPASLLSWIIQLAEQYKLSADDIHRALNAAWNRNARPGRKNRPHFWKWFYEVLRNAFIPGYAARIPEATS